MPNPAFAHRHYKLIADVLRQRHAELDTAGTQYDEGEREDRKAEIDAIASALANVFQRDNGRFDRARFEGACAGDYATKKDKVR